MLETNNQKNNDPKTSDHAEGAPQASPEGTPPPPEGIFEENSPSGAPELDPHAAVGDIQKQVATEADPDDTLTDPETDRAVNEITKTEGDAILKAEDEVTEKAFIMKPNMWERLKNAYAKWWNNRPRRYTTLGVILAVVLVVFFVPAIRYFVLNNVGVRTHATIQVLDATTGLPLKNVSVTLAGKSAETNISGKANVQGVRLGKQTLTVRKTAFASYQKIVTVGISGITVPGISLKAVGSQFTFQVTNFLSSKAVASAEVVSGDANALSDENGKAILTIQPTDGQTVQVTVHAKGYRDQPISFNPASTKPTNVSLVSSAKEVYVTKASGKYDLYTVDLDGQHKHLLLAGTGIENQNITMTVSPDNNEVALVSTRDNQRDADGYLLSTLTLIHVSDGSTVTLEHAEQISLVGWSNTKLLYETVTAGASASNPSRQKIISYDYTSNKRLQLVTANYFNVLTLIGSVVYYGTSSTDPSINPMFAKVAVDGTNKSNLLNREVWSLFRTDYKTLYLQTPNAWSTYTVGSGVTKPANAPADYISRDYLDSSDASNSLWVDTRDGKGVLLNYDVSADKDTVVTSQGGLTKALRWVDKSTIIYRVTNAQETADYAMSLDGGSAKKIVDVTGTYGISSN